MSVMDNVLRFNLILPHRYPFCSSIASVSSIRTVGSWGSKTSRLTSRFSRAFPGASGHAGGIDPRGVGSGGRRPGVQIARPSGPSGGLCFTGIDAAKFRKPSCPAIFCD